MASEAQTDAFCSTANVGIHAAVCLSIPALQMTVPHCHNITEGIPCAGIGPTNQPVSAKAQPVAKSFGWLVELIFSSWSIGRTPQVNPRAVRIRPGVGSSGGRNRIVASKTNQFQ
jgi:hypothetical protein